MHKRAFVFASLGVDSCVHSRRNRRECLWVYLRIAEGDYKVLIVIDVMRLPVPQGEIYTEMLIMYC